MKRGEIRWYTFKTPDKKRPVLILTRSSIIDYLNEITIAPITTTVRDIPSEVFLPKSIGMPRDCAINFDHIQTVSKSKIGSLIAMLPSQYLDQVGGAISFALEI
jgi:mRNA interferase MazF